MWSKNQNLSNKADDYSQWPQPSIYDETYEKVPQWKLSIEKDEQWCIIMVQLFYVRAFNGIDLLKDEGMCRLQLFLVVKGSELPSGREEGNKRTH